MKRRLSFYVTIEGITIRLKNVSLLEISHVAEQLADIDELSNAEVSVTSADQNYDCQCEDEDEFVDYVKKVSDYIANRENDLMPIDLVSAAIKEELSDIYITKRSNMLISVQSKSNFRKKFKVFAALLDDIELYVEPANSQPVSIKFNKIEDLIRHLHAIEYFGL
jgi:hypothetical protein